MAHTKPKETKQFYTTGELADICQVSPTTIFRAIINKYLKASTTPGGHFRISRKEAEDFLRKNRIPMPAEHRAVTRILIVEDNPAERRLLQRVLSPEPHYSIQSAATGYEAGFLTQSFKPHLILLDIFLPDIDGRQVIQLIRSHTELNHTRIIAITSAKDPQDIKEIKASGIDGFIQKPLRPDKILSEIQEFLL